MTDTARAAERTAWQHHAAAVLGPILERAAAEGLAPIASTVASAGSGLVGRSKTYPMAQRRDGFDTWRAASPRGRARTPTCTGARSDSSGTVRLADQWERYEHVTLTLAADLYAED